MAVTNHSGHYVVYQDKLKQWRWRFRARNGRIIADSGEGYQSKEHCVDAINMMASSGGCAIQYI